jgi:glycosyltransferase involved in cell wall biosynthesis
VLTDGVSALLLPPGKTEALAQACIRVLSARDEALALAASARQIVETQFTSRVVAERVASLYRSL